MRPAATGSGALGKTFGDGFVGPASKLKPVKLANRSSIFSAAGRRGGGALLAKAVPDEPFAVLGAFSKLAKSPKPSWLPVASAILSPAPEKLPNSSSLTLAPVKSAVNEVVACTAGVLSTGGIVADVDGADVPTGKMGAADTMSEAPAEEKRSPEIWP